MSTWAAPRPRASRTVDMALLSDRIVVAMDQYAALCAASATRKPVEILPCVMSSFLLVLLRVCSAVIAAALVMMLDMGVDASRRDIRERTCRTWTGITGRLHAF